MNKETNRRGYMKMNDRIYRVLEFHKIIEQLKQQTETSLGKQLASQIAPKTILTEVNQTQLETDEAAQISRLNKAIPLGGIVDIRPNLKRCQLGGTLNTQECLDVATTIYGGGRTKRFFEKLDIDLPILKDLADGITPLRDLEQAINMCIDENGVVLDQASSKLRGIRSSIRTSESRIRERLDAITRTQSNLLSDAIVTIRNDRYVLPVKHEYRATVGGIVHDQSASGQTLFMEPKAVVELNNKLYASRAEEKQEIEKILRKLSEQIADYHDVLTENVMILGEIDFIYARAKLARLMKATKPNMNDQGFIKMNQARHPLIPENDVVANDIEIGQAYTTIVITGPNTGGKTVTLKMVGLCTLMAQSGLQVPALDGCQMAVFSNVFADIGDEQSIEQNLSTFSSHMSNIVSIMEHVDDESLVLFDELGAGTDPQEGAALAMSILDDVMARNARVIATTHYPELKAYGYNRDRVINASVEFNVETLQPTYRLLLGVPGRSNAFEISKRLGLDANIIAKAKTHIGVDSKNVESMISALEDSKRLAEKEYEEAHAILMQSDQLRADLKQSWHTLEQKQEQLYKKAEEKAEKALQKARTEAEQIVKDLREMQTATTFKEHEWIDAKKRLEDSKLNLTDKKETQKNTASDHAETGEIQAGDDVKLLTLNQRGTVLEQINDHEYNVQVGMMRVNVSKENLQLLKKQKEAKLEPVAMVRGSNQQVGMELDLRGERFEDAVAKLEKYIDEALLAGHPRVTIIHGKGTGALRKGVQQFAKKHRQIKEYRPGSMSEGGSGVTIIEFK